MIRKTTFYLFFAFVSGLSQRKNGIFYKNISRYIEIIVLLMVFENLVLS